MIRHIVMFKLKETKSEEKMDGLKKEIKYRLESLPEKIKVIKSMEVGINVVMSERAWDLVLVSVFSNLDDLDTYRVHPEHLKVVQFIAEVKEKTAAVDYHI